LVKGKTGESQRRKATSWIPSAENMPRGSPKLAQIYRHFGHRQHLPLYSQSLGVAITD
jgi:hypothetical protein